MAELDSGSQSADFEALADQRSRELLDALSDPMWKLWLQIWRTRPRDPELRKLLGRLHTAVREARRIEAEQPGGLERGRSRAIHLLSIDARAKSIDAVLELIDGWDQLLIEHGDELYIGTLLVAERTRDQRQTTSTTWRGVFDSEPPAGWGHLKTGDRLDSKELAKGKGQLASLYTTRSIMYDLDRARRQMQVRHLVLLIPVLAVLVIGLGLAVVALAPDAPVAIVAVAGALGATVSGTRKLRDEVPNINALRAYTPAIVVQPLLGAAAGLLLLLAVVSGVLGLESPGQSWALLGALAFAAGFSEPVFLSVVARVAAIGEPSKDGEKGPRTD